MRIGILSDSHDNVARTRLATRLLNTHDAEVLLHAGDLTTGAMIPLLERWRTWLAQGNVDDAASIRARIAERKSPVTYGELHEIALDGLRFGLLHGDDAGRLAGMINSGAFDVVVHGHTHKYRNQMVGETRVLNPGAIHRTDAPSVCILDTESNTVQRLLLG